MAMSKEQAKKMIKSASTKKEGNVPSLFDKLPPSPSPRSKIHSFLPLKDLYNLSRTSTELKSEIANELEQRLSSPLNLLLLSVLRGEESEVISTLEQHPEYLLENISIAKDYSGRTFTDIKALQTAICTMDVEMLEKMKPYFDKLPNGQNELNKQFDEVIPNGIEKHVEQQQIDTKDSMSIFNNIADAIIASSDEDVKKALDKEFDTNLELHKILDEFRNNIHNLFNINDKPLKDKVYNPYHLLNAYNCYIEKFDNFKNWEQRYLFLRQVIGYTQRFVPACFAQSFAQGLYYTTTDPTLERSLTFKRTPPTARAAYSFYPLIDRDGLGFNWAAGPYASLWVECDGNLPRARYHPRVVSELLSSKNIRLGKITSRQVSAACCELK